MRSRRVSGRDATSLLTEYISMYVEYVRSSSILQVLVYERYNGQLLRGQYPDKWLRTDSGRCVVPTQGVRTGQPVNRPIRRTSGSRDRVVSIVRRGREESGEIISLTFLPDGRFNIITWTGDPRVPVSW